MIAQARDVDELSNSSDNESISEQSESESWHWLSEHKTCPTGHVTREGQDAKSAAHDESQHKI